MASPPNRTALILSGGGSYGAYEVGVLRALLSGQSIASNYRPFCPDIITGTSVGALNGALLLTALRDDPIEAVEHLERIYLEEIADTPGRCGNGILRFRANPLDLFDAACYTGNPAGPFLQFASDATFLAGQFARRAADFINSRADLEQRTLDFLNVSVFLDTQRVMDLVRRHISARAIRTCGKELQIIATNWQTGVARQFRPEELDEERLRRAVLASAAIPGIFPPVEIDGELYADGGMVMSAALRPAIRAGATELHLVYVDPIAEDLPLPDAPSTAHSVYRSLVISLAAMLKRDLEYARRINLGIDLLESAARQQEDGSFDSDAQRALTFLAGAMARRSATRRPYQKITVHNYRLREPNRNLVQWLSFGEEHLQELIARGYEDARNHNCLRDLCISAGAGNEFADY
jgi:NTE family protein